MIAYFRRNLLRVLHGLANDSSGGWIPRVEDLYRLQIEAVTYIDKDGFASSPAGDGRLRSRTGTKIADPFAHMSNSPTESGHEQLSTEGNGVSTAEPPQPNVNGFHPMDFLANSTGLAFGAPTSALAEGGGLGQRGGIGENGDPPVLPIELMIYNNLMMDIGGSAGFFEQDFLNSVLFGSTPPLLATGQDTGPVQGVEYQT